MFSNHIELADLKRFKKNLHLLLKADTVILVQFKAGESIKLGFNYLIWEFNR